MRIAYFDAIGGAAGDMILGSLLDAGLPLADLEGELAKLSLSGYSLRREPARKGAIVATQFHVDIDAPDHDHHDHGAHDAHHGRSLTRIVDVISASALPARVKDRAVQVFQNLGEAEARIHGVALDEVHFHEVGAVDSIVDIVGACIALDLLGIERVFASPLPVGSGTVQTQHGLFPVPAPATLELLARAQVPIIADSVHAEQVTPTGAAILTSLATFERPAMTLDRVGYGAGQADLAIPNVLRVWLGETAGGKQERLTVLETNIDDMNPELYGPVLQRLLDRGALDAYLTPIVMKKGRPGTQIGVLCRPSDRQHLSELLLCETTTMGVRWYEVERCAAARSVEEVETAYGAVAVTVKWLDGRPAAAVPEFEDCRRLAESAGVPVLNVYAAAAAAGQHVLDSVG